ncbi:MAG: beta-phosphoglucomutase [Velocimicrobium sp.]
MLRAVIFDLDGVITDSARYHYQAWKQLADRLNIPFDEAYNEKLKGVSRMESLDLILKNGKTGAFYSEEEKEKFAIEKNEIYKKRINQMTPNDVLPGILTLLKEIKRAKLLIAIASVSRNARTIIERLQIEEYIDYIANVEKIKHAKPYPDIFLACARTLQVEPKDCIGIEDAKTGIEAIHRAGMLAVGVGSTEQMKEADLILEGTGQLSLKILQKFYNQSIERLFPL